MKIIGFLILLFIQSPLLADTYNEVVSGKKCQEDNGQQLSCSYKVGKSLFIEIAAIGSQDTGVAFLKSDYKGDFYGKYGLMHGCVIVHNGNNIFDMAFISPKNGKVYKSWRECKHRY